MFLLSLLRKGDFRATSSIDRRCPAFECALGSHLWFVGCVYRFKLYSTRRANTHLHAYKIRVYIDTNMHIYISFVCVNMYVCVYIYTYYYVCT